MEDKTRDIDGRDQLQLQLHCISYKAKSYFELIKQMVLWKGEFRYHRVVASQYDIDTGLSKLPDDGPHVLITS